MSVQPVAGVAAWQLNHSASWWGYKPVAKTLTTESRD